MADEEIKNQEVEEATEVSEQEPQDTAVDTAKEAELDGPSPGMLEKIASIFKRGPKKEPTEEESAEEAEPDSGADEAAAGDEEESVETGGAETDKKDEYEEIDPTFVKVARKYGWDDKRIIDYAEGHSEEDVLLLSSLMQDFLTKSQSDDKTVIEDKTAENELLDSKALLELAEGDPKVAAALKRAIEPLAKQLESISSTSEELKKALGSKEEERRIEETVRNYEIAMEMFDKAGIPSLGKTEELPTYPDGSFVINHPAFQERAKVWDVAQAFYATGGTFKKAMENALQWYKGGNLEKEIQDKIVKDLKKQEQRVTPRRQSASETKVYANEEERKADVINEALRKYNKELPVT